MSKNIIDAYLGIIAESMESERAAFNKANETVHPVETQWHHKILVKHGFVPKTKEAKGFVRNYEYEHPNGHTVRAVTGASSDYWEGTTHGTDSKGHGYHASLEAHAKKINAIKKVAEEIESLYEFEGVPYTLGSKVDKDKIYKVHRANAKGEMEHNPGDVYHSLDDAKRVAGNMGKSGSKTKITVHARTKLAGPQGKLPE